jgi:hypothetical protein
MLFVTSFERDVHLWDRKFTFFEHECRLVYTMVLREVAALSEVEMLVMWVNCED